MAAKPFPDRGHVLAAEDLVQALTDFLTQGLAEVAAQEQIQQAIAGLDQRLFRFPQEVGVIRRGGIQQG
jgi:hypothetical protein